ncbi:MAG TPA: amino acid ABC transporter permease [Nocardioidaceae bacterium]|nr:amino acid ABC transporter permease [Nocardioidaceae bacterium]
MTFYFGDILPYLPVLLHALWISVYVTLIGFAAGSVAGVLISLARSSGVRALSASAGVYIEIFRNTPLLVQLYLIYFGLGQVGINFNPFWSAVVGLTLNNAAYTAEIFRAGFESVPAGLREAASALGMTPVQNFRYVVLKPAVRNVLPSLTNQLIVLFLFSSVGSVIALPELTNELSNINSLTNRTLETFTYGAVLYYLVSVAMAMSSRLAEKTLFRW